MSEPIFSAENKELGIGGFIYEFPGRYHLCFRDTDAGENVEVKISPEQGPAWLERLKEEARQFAAAGDFLAEYWQIK